ncbi:MAG: hypothetical protein K0B01_14790 [Syntrophobacterales bacterium]|nr:hypothetical protein [Syntrophobacterales bacterium]
MGAKSIAACFHYLDLFQQASVFQLCMQGFFNGDASGRVIGRSSANQQMQPEHFAFAENALPQGDFGMSLFPYFLQIVNCQLFHNGIPACSAS